MTRKQSLIFVEVQMVMATFNTFEGKKTERALNGKGYVWHWKVVQLVHANFFNMLNKQGRTGCAMMFFQMKCS